MNKRRCIGFVVLVVCLLIGTSVVIRHHRKTVNYRGQSLQSWSMLAYQGNSNAVATLQELGTNAMPELIRLLRTQDSFLRKQTWTHLPRLPRRLRQIIARKFPPPQAEVVREAAARALGRLGPDARSAIPALSQALRDNEGRVRWESATALGCLGKDSVPVLIKAVDESDTRTRHATVYALGQIGIDAVEAVPALVRCLGDPDQSVRNSAAYSLTTIGIPGFLALVNVSEHAEGPARGMAASMLTNSYLPQLKVSSELFKMAHDESPATRKRALDALRAIRVAGGLAIRAAMDALEDPVMDVRLAAIKALGARGGPDENAVLALTDCLNDTSPQIRAAAARALGELGDHARVAVPELTRLAQEKEESVSAAAKGAIGSIIHSKPDETSVPKH